MLERYLTNSTARALAQLITIGLTAPIRLLLSLTPKLQKRWIIGHRHGLGDNAFRIANHIAESHPDIELYWLSNQCLPASDAKFRIIARHSLRSYWIQATASKFIVSTGLYEAGSIAPFFRAKYYQLWHGWPIKKVLLDSPESLPSNRSAYRSFWHWLLIRQLKRYRLVFCHDEAMKEIFGSGFGLASNRLAITGWPRLLAPKSSNSFKQSSNTISYLPTWRTNANDISENMQQLLSDEFQRFLATEQLQLKIKLHPLNIDVAAQFSALPPAVSFTQDSADNLIRTSRLIISDYSSIIIDAAVVYQAKVYLFDSNYAEYIKSRGIYSAYQPWYKNLPASASQLTSAIASKDCILVTGIQLAPADCCDRIVTLIKQN